MIYKWLVYILYFTFSNSIIWANQTKNSYEQSNFQMSLRVGLLNSSLMGEFKLAKKLNLSVDAGAGVNHFYSDRGYYNKYNYQYDKYNKKTDEFINFGSEPYWCGYIATNLRYIFNQNTKLEYAGKTKINSFAYLSLQLRGNTQRWTEPYNNNPEYDYRETYRLGFLIGRQLATSSDALFFYDFAGGLGITTNYKFATFAPFPIISIRFGVNLFRL